MFVQVLTDEAYASMGISMVFRQCMVHRLKRNGDRDGLRCVICTCTQVRVGGWVGML